MSMTMFLGFVYITAVFIQNCVSSESSTSHPLVIGDIRECLTGVGRDVSRFGVLPGVGWDNLRNKAGDMVVFFNYSQCRTTDDGKYLIPDNVFTVPVKTSQVEISGETFQHWSDYVSTTAFSINSEASLFYKGIHLSGSFSAEKETVKRNQVLGKSVTTRIQARYVRYSAKLQHGSQLSSVFRQQILNIANNIRRNLSTLAEYESQILIRDFGTHILSSVDAGAVVSQTDQVKSSFLRNLNKDTSRLLAAAGGSFRLIFRMSNELHTGTSKQFIDTYEGNRTHSVISTNGGPIFKPSNFSLNDWASEIRENLVAVDRGGFPIYEVINARNFPHTPVSVIYSTFEQVKNAVEEYYKFNTYRGCTDIDSPNFSYLANVDDGTCSYKVGNYSFGGVYQTCTQTGQLNARICPSLVQKNPLTGDFSCPDGFESVFLLNGKVSSSEVRRRCTSCGFLWLDTCCSNYYVYGSAQYNTYWCVGKSQSRSHLGFLFGGTYTSNVDNPLTQARECPLHFYPLAMSTDIKLCVSDDFELGFRYAVSFAGLFSCKSGNPLAIMKEDVSKNNSNNMHSYLTSANSELWPHACPTGYSNHLAALAESCEISYCVKSQSFSKQEFQSIRRPPFIELPRMAFLQLDENNGTFQALTGSNQSSQISSNPTSSEKSVNNMTSIIIISVLFSITALAMFIFVGFCIRRRLRKSGGKEVHEESRSQGGETESRSDRTRETSVREMKSE
ncbi:macrophage-expressed gene 1 protein-like [Ostrea edulis]|uniref:macrophage-expressed gene 1 protein-like n=1 Tax=Ostrea edulis TaxID=37623 RepID=UPI0024AFC3FA|nr:macrophage-expressed gene 1 protein-like [Ostrea edulis]